MYFHRSSSSSLLLIAMLYLVTANAAASMILTCKPSKQFFCDQSSCLQKKSDITYIILEPSRERYQRCDNHGCSSTQVFIHQSGIFLYANHLSGLMKVSIDRGGFTDIATHHLNSYITFGTCTKEYS